MTISHRASAGLAGQSTSTTVTFTMPTGHTADDLLLAWLGVKAYTVNLSSGTLSTDYTAAGDKTSGTVVNGVGVGSTHMYGRYRTHDGTESAPTCVTSAIASPSMAAMSAYSKTEAGAWNIATTVGADTAASGASVSITSDATLALASGDTLVFGVALPDDTADMGSIAISATGITFGTITQRLTTTGTTSGNDGAMRVYDVPITAGSGTVTVTVTATNTNSGESEAAAVFVRLREPVSGNATFTTVAGGESASGGSTSLTGDAGFSTTASADNASGGSTTFSTSTDATFTGTTGGESAAGGSSTFTGDGAFTSTTSADTASGGSTTISGGGSFVTTVSADTADGGSSTYTGGADFATVASGDSAAGGSSTLTGDGSFSTVASADTADGGSTTFDTGANGTFTTNASADNAAGGSSSFTGDAGFATTVSADTASGGSTTLTGDAAFTTTASADTASGGSTTFDASGGTPPAAWIGNAINALSGSSVSCTLPPWSAGKTGVVLVASEAATNGNTCTTPTGYTYVTDFISNSSSRMYVFAKSFGDSDSGATVTAAWSATNRIAIAAVVVENATLDTFATTGAGSGTTINIPTLTAGGADGVEVVFFGGRTDAGDITTFISSTPSGFSNAQTVSTTATGTSRNVILGSATLDFSSASLTATTATASASINSRAGVSISLLGASVNVNGTFATNVGTGTAAGEVGSFTGSASSGTFTTTVGSATAAGGNTTFATAVVDAEFLTVRTLNHAPPAGWESFTTYNIGATGGPYTLNDSTDYKIVFTAVRTAVCDIRGGRNLVILGMPIGGRKTAPALTSSYDASGRGLRIQDGSNPNNPRVIHVEGLYVEEGTYNSDSIQIALRTENDVKIVIQNMRVNGINWGNNTTTPNVHSDVIQSYGGPTTLIIDGLVAEHATYQGIIVNPSDGRTLPTGTPEPWLFKNIYIAGDNLTGYGVRYLLYNNMPGHPAFSWTPIINESVYLSGSSRNVTDSSGDWPSAGLTQNTVAPRDFVPEGLWSGASHDYTSPGYVSMATASGGSTSFSTAPVSTFSTVVGGATADGGLSTFTGSSDGSEVFFGTLVGQASASGGVGTLLGVTPGDGLLDTLVGSATASGGQSTMFGTASEGTFYFTPPVLLNRSPVASDIGYTVYKKDGVYTLKMAPSDEDVAGAEVVYVGGHAYEISPDERNALVSAGYSVSSTPL